MTICDLKRGDRGVVLKVECDGPLREKLISLGVFTGAKLIVLKISPFRHTYLIQAGSGRLLLRKEAAAGVRIWKM